MHFESCWQVLEVGVGGGGVGGRGEGRKLFTQWYLKFFKESILSNLSITIIILEAVKL